MRASYKHVQNVGVSALEKGEQLHSHLEERGLESDVVVDGSLVNMYAKCGKLTNARIMFDGLSYRNVVTWNAMISCYAQQEGMGRESLNMYMYSVTRNECEATPTAVTYVCLLQACANVGPLQLAKQLHSNICEGGFESDVGVETCLVKMYAECGRLDVARQVRLPTKSLETWTALLKGYAEHGEGGKAVQCFEECTPTKWYTFAC